MFIRHIFVFFGYGLFTLFLIYTGEITKFLSPRLVWLSYFSGFSLGLFLFVLSMRDEIKNKSDIKSKWRETAKGILLIYPLILFFTVKPSDISAVNTPAVKIIPPQKSASKKAVLSSLPVDSDGYVRLNLFELWLLARNYPELAQRYKFKTTGMVKDISEKYITLIRIFMTCCAADATPVEIEVAIKSKESINKGDWVILSGSVLIRDYVIIIPDYIEASQKPSDVYITRWSEEPPFNP